ncbi:hypothetical protein PVL29_026051 [Vitis rotundifolia]|uniref:Tubby C-terminal domain-containing protein n=1 Tax=Vitis rotundifolia TaxID=103349 RepID=A0AA38YLI6_VITRO|nr:hypothetical protein PVL29_026051 [Vitis rotundifolia]
MLKIKAPRWHEQLQCCCLNFHGRVTIASVKIFQLVASSEDGSAGQQHEKIILQFGKVGKVLFTMDYRYPISAFQVKCCQEESSSAHSLPQTDKVTTHSKGFIMK